MPSLFEVYAAVQPGRRIHGIAAALLPYRTDGTIAEDDFVRHLRATHAAGLTNAVNMDTGYVNLLTDEEKERVLELASSALGPETPFVAGAYIEGQDGAIVEHYRREMERIVRFGGTPILFQTSSLHGLPPALKAKQYAAACKGFPEVLAFELGRMFAPNGEIWDEETFLRILEIPEIKGAKHSSLSKVEELKRLALRDQHRPDFRVYTGNDLGIDMIEHGSDYLLGLATFHPEAFAARDRAWERGDVEYLELKEALQYLGNVAFRSPVPAYKHSAAVFLRLRGKIESDAPHPRCPRRPDWEPEILDDCRHRLAELGYD
jgi:dihydrodipicolinate synthase/N-acetylneuraminate lyase